MADVSNLIDGFSRLKQRALQVGKRSELVEEISHLLNAHFSNIISGDNEQEYNGGQLLHDLITCSIQEIVRNEDKGIDSKAFRREVFDMAVKFVAKAILADSIEADQGKIVIEWYHRICKSTCVDIFIEPVLSCVHAYFATVTACEIPGQHIIEVWKDLWKRFSVFHSGANPPFKYISSILECLAAILKIAEHTPLADHPWKTVNTVIDGLGLRNEDSKVWLRHRPATCSELLRMLRMLLHQWGFTYRVQLVASMEYTIRGIAAAIEFDSNMATWRMPWSEIKKCSAMEQSWLLLEEYASLVAPKGCPIHIPTGTAPMDSVLVELADQLVVKYAKCSTSTRSVPPSPGMCRLAARALVVLHRLQSTGSTDEEEGGGGMGVGCNTQLASFTKMKLSSQFASQFGSQFSSQAGTQRSHFTSTQKLVKRRKRKRDVKMLQAMASLDFKILLNNCTSAHQNEYPTDWARFVIECMTQVFEGHVQDLGSDVADLMQLTIASTKNGVSEELIPSIARLLCTVMERRNEEMSEERRTDVDTPSTSRRSSRGSNGICSDGAAVSELWSRAHSWTHMPTCFETATRLMIECDRWLLSHEESSMHQPELRWTRMIEVLKPAPFSSTTAIDLLQHLIANYEFDEKERLTKHDEKHKGQDWPFRRELIDWLLCRDATLDISSAIVAVCSYYPKREIVRPIDRRSSPWTNQECRMRVLVRTQFDGEKEKEKERNARPDTLIREMVEAVVEKVGRDSTNDLTQLRRLCVLQRLTTRVKKEKIKVDEPTPAGASSDILNESILSVRREMEVEGMDGLAEMRWASCQWFERHGVNAIDTEILLRLLQHEEIIDGLPDMHFHSLLLRRDNERNEEDRERLTALTSIMRQFMMDYPEAEKMVPAIESMAACSSLHLVNFTMRRMGDVMEKLTEAAENVMDVQTMIYKYGHMVLPESRARLIDKMSRLVEEEEDGRSFANHMEEIVIAHYATEIPLEYAIHYMDKQDDLVRVTSLESLVSRLQLESDRGEMTGECEELIKACLSPSRWEDHADAVKIVMRWPELMKRCLTTQPLLCSIMDEMAAAIDIDTVIKKEIKDEEMDEENYDKQHKDYIDLENLWSPMQREISRVCSRLRVKKEQTEGQFSCSMADSSLPTSLLLPRVDWKILQREWNGTMQSHAIKIIVEYGKRCEEIGLELRFLHIIEYLIGHNSTDGSGKQLRKISPYLFLLEPLAEQAVWSIHRRCSSHSTDFSRASMQWSRIRNLLRSSVSPSHLRLRPVLKGHQSNMFEEKDFDPENLSALISTQEWWERAIVRWENIEKQCGGDSSALATLRSHLIDAYRTLHEARCVPETAATVLPKLATKGMGEMARSTFDGPSFSSWLRLHIELWWYGRRFTECTPEEIEVIMDTYSEVPLGERINGQMNMPSERRGEENDLLHRLLRLAYNTTKENEWKCLLARLTTVLPALNLHYECLPYIVSFCPKDEAIELLLMASPDLLQEREEEKKEKEREGRRERRRREDREVKRRVGDVALVMEECITVAGISSFSRVCEENGRDAEQPLEDMAKLAIDSGVMSLARICIDLAAESSLPNRSLFLFEPTFTLPDCLEDTKKAAVIATRDAVTARSLRSSTQAQNEIRRILAESRYDWHLSTSSEARAALDEEENNYLLRFTQWTSFSKLLSNREKSLNGALVLMQKDEDSCQRVVDRLRSSISTRLCSTRDLLSNGVREDVRCAELLRIFKEEKDVSTLPSSLTSLSSSSFSQSSSHLNEDCLLRVGVALAKWSRRMEEGKKGREEGRMESFSTLSERDLTHKRVEEAVRHLEGIRAYKPALRLLNQWSKLSSLSESSSIKAKISLDEARIRVHMGEVYVGLHVIEEIKKENQGDERILARSSFLEADITLEHSRNREKSRQIVKKALTLLRPIADSLNGEDARLMHEAHARIFDQTAKILEETQTIMESRGFTMKREAIDDWTIQLEELMERARGRSLDDNEKRTKVRLEREAACEAEEIDRMETRMAELAIECIVSGLDALKSSSNTKPDTSAEILFPLLDVIFKYGQTDQVAAIIKEHIIQSDCLYFIQGVGHIIGHIFKETPITKPLRVLLAKLVMQYPYHTLPRLLFYYDAGGAEETNIRNVIDFAIKKRQEVAGDVNKIVKAHFMFRDFTAADVANRTLFTKGLVKEKVCHRMSERVSLLRDQETLKQVPMPTVHLVPGQSIDTVPHITSVNDVFFQADGLSVPKVLTVRTSDGVERRIICKKEDVRQDAMVEHLFEAVNTILRQANGGRQHQELRTYKVIPLDLNNGLIEFCGGTISLKELLCGADRVSGLHKEIHPEDMTAKEAYAEMANARREEKVKVFKEICKRFRPVFRHYFYKAYGSPRDWSEKLDAYRRSLAQWSIVCYIVGLGDRHSSNVLFEPSTAKFVHIDLGMILEYSKRSLPVPERVPFRLTRDLVDPLIGDALDGHFTVIAVDTIVALRKKSSVLLGIASALLRETMSNFEEAAPRKDSSLISKAAIGRLRDKLEGTDAGFAPQTPEEQVRRLIGEATDIQNLATIFQGWMPFL